MFDLLGRRDRDGSSDFRHNKRLKEAGEESTEDSERFSIYQARDILNSTAYPFVCIGINEHLLTSHGL
jgi:hypothetical protein